MLSIVDTAWKDKHIFHLLWLGQKLKLSAFRIINHHDPYFPPFPVTQPPFHPFCICRLLDTDQTFQACQSTLQLWAGNSNSRESLINGMEKKAKNGGNNWIDYVLLINCGIVLNIYWFWRVLSWTLELIWWWSRWFNCWGTSFWGFLDTSSLIFWLC